MKNFELGQFDRSDDHTSDVLEARRMVTVKTFTLYFGI